MRSSTKLLLRSVMSITLAAMALDPGLGRLGTASMVAGLDLSVRLLGAPAFALGGRACTPPVGATA